MSAQLLSQVVQEEGGKAIPFITIDEKSGRFEVTQAAMVFLESLPRNQRVAIVSIAGPYRTGKSFLANRLLNQSKGFDIGSTTQACTKGIWMWNRAVSISPDMQMILIDTEGLASTERSTNIDIKIFSLSILLSSMFIYNQMGPITENSLEDLALVGNLTNHIAIQQNQSKSEQPDFKQYFPAFFWVLRDFYHDLEGRSPKQYLEDCLKEAPGFTADVMKKNKIRQAILRHFKERECFTLIRPVSDESKLAHVEEVGWDSDDLKKQFRNQVTNFVNQVGKKLKPKVISGKYVNSSMFLSLALEYTEAISAKETPTVLTALDRVVQAETVKTIDEAYEAFKAEVDEKLGEDMLPMPAGEFGKIVKKAAREHKLQMQKELSQILSFQEILLETQKYKLRVKDIIDAKYQANYSASYHFSKGLISKLLQVFNNGEAKEIHEYLRQWAQVIKEYKEAGQQSSLQWQVLIDAIVKMNPDQSILQLSQIDSLVETPEGRHMDQDEDEAYSTTNTDRNKQQEEQENYMIDLFAKFVESLISSLSQQLGQLKQSLTDSQANERRLAQTRKQNDQLVEMQRQQNEELAAMKNDFDVRIESLRRDVTSRQQELQSLQQIKEAELKALRHAQERQAKESEDEHRQLELQKGTLHEQHQQLMGRVQELESEKRKEVSQIQHEIKKLEEDIEGLKNKMKSKENNPFFVQVNQFFAEVKDYMEEYRKLCSQQDGSREQKKGLFALQRRLAEVEYAASQRELTLKKQLDEQFRQHKDQLEKAFEARQAEVEAERQRVQALQDRRQAFEQQLGQSLGLIQDAKERQMTLVETRDYHKRQALAVKEVKVKDLKDNLEQMKKGQVQMEDKIYMLSIENKQRQDDKEAMLMLLPHIYKAIKGNSNKIKEILSQIENEGLKNKVMKVLQAYKVPGWK